MLRRFTVSSLAAGLVLGTVALPAAAQEAGSLACPGGAPDAGYADVSSANTHSDAIDCGTALGIIEGRSDTAFAPATSVTRAQVASLLARTLDDLDADLPGADGAPSFSDIGAPHADNIRRLAAVGIVEGRADGSFGPNQAVRRDQLASLFVRAVEFALGGELTPLERGHFDDVVGGVHAVNIDTAFELGLVQGKGDGRFAPLDPTRRDQAASVVVRFLDGILEVVESPFSLTLLHANDGESALLPEDLGGSEGDPGAARFVAAIEAARAAAAAQDGLSASLTISSGDNFLAGPQLAASTDTDGDEFYDAMVYDLAGFDAMTIGNHEFDFGPERFADFVEAVGDQVPFLSANLDVSAEPRLAELEDEGRIADSTTIRVLGRDVAVVGATTEELANISSPRGVTVSDVQEAVQAEVDAVRAAGAEIVVVSSHLQDIDNEVELAPELSGVDAIIGGGGGENLREDEGRTYPLVAEDADGTEVPIVTTPGRYRDVGNLVLQFDGSDDLVEFTEGSELIAVPLDGPKDPATVSAVEEPVAAYVADLAETVVAETQVPLDGIRATVRTRETNLANVLTDGMLDVARDRAEEFGVPEADVAIQNGGGIRNESVLTGDITALDTFNVAPFGNFVAVDTISGVTLREAIEHGLAGLPSAAGQFAHWAGVEFTYDATLPAGARVIDATVTQADGGTYDLVTAGVTNPTAAAEEFTIAGLNFTLGGGDAFPFDGSFTILGLTDQQALQRYLGELGTVTAAQYPDLTVDEDRYHRYGPITGDFVD